MEAQYANIRQTIGDMFDNISIYWIPRFSYHRRRLELDIRFNDDRRIVIMSDCISGLFNMWSMCGALMVEMQDMNSIIDHVILYNSYKVKL